MTIPGPVMHRQLMDGYKDLQQRIEQMRSGLSSIDSQRGELGDDRGEALVDLAEHYLPDLTRESIQASWTESRPALTQVLMRKEDQRRRVTDALSTVSDKRNLEDDRLLEINSSLDQAKSIQDELSSKVESELAGDNTFVSLSGRAATAEAALERGESNLSEIEQDAARKLPQYEQSSLFNYLREQNFGTSGYTKRGLTRRMDRWLAKFVDYNKAIQSYNFLVKTPEQMRTIIANDRAAFDTVMDELESRRDLVIKRLGLSSAIEKVNQLSARREKQLVELDEVREETESLTRELTDLEDSRGSYYAEAVAVFREMLDGMDSQDLASKARRTPSLTDDQIVARIQGVEERLDDLDQETRQYHDDTRDMQRCNEGLGRLLQRFRASKFDAARSQFLPSVDVLEDLHRAKNEADIDDLWKRLRRAQRWGPSLSQQLGHVASNPITQVLMGAMTQATSAKMRGHADRAGKRRYQNQRNQKRYDSRDSSRD